MEQAGASPGPQAVQQAAAGEIHHILCEIAQYFQATAQEWADRVSLAITGAGECKTPGIDDGRGRRREPGGGDGRIPEPTGDGPLRARVIGRGDFRRRLARSLEVGPEGASARGSPQAGTKDHTAAATNRRRAGYRGEGHDRHPPTTISWTSIRRVDILEIYGGWAEVSYQAHAFGLRASQPIEKDLGTEVTDGSQTALRKLVQRLCPWLTLWELPCTHWSRWQYINYYSRPEEFANLRRGEETKVYAAVNSRRRQAGQVLPARATREGPRFGHVPDPRRREAEEPPSLDPCRQPSVCMRRSWREGRLSLQAERVVHQQPTHR